MQIAANSLVPPATPTTAPAPPTPDRVTVRPGDRLIPGPVPSEYPAMKFARLFSGAIFGLQGSTHMTYTITRPNEIRLAFMTYDFAKMADIALRDEVVGVKLIYTDGFDNVLDMTKPAAPWADFTPNVTRNLGGMSGVSDVRWNGARYVLLVPDTTETRVNLQRLVEPSIGDVRIWWKGQCTGSGCKPDPAPPELHAAH